MTSKRQIRIAWVAYPGALQSALFEFAELFQTASKWSGFEATEFTLTCWRERRRAPTAHVVLMPAAKAVTKRGS